MPLGGLGGAAPGLTDGPTEVEAEGGALEDVERDVVGVSMSASLASSSSIARRCLTLGVIRSSAPLAAL